MALQNLQQYGCQTGNKLKEKSRDLNGNSSRFFFKEPFGSVIIHQQRNLFSDSNQNADI
jgi:hypothetical protein